MHIWKIFYMGVPDKPALYAMTSSKEILKKFKKQRNMKKFVVNKSEEDYCDYDVSFARDTNLNKWLEEYEITHYDYDDDKSDVEHVYLVLTGEEFNKITEFDELFDFMMLHTSKKNYHNYLKEKYFVSLVTLGYDAFKELDYTLNDANSPSYEKSDDLQCYYGANDSDVELNDAILDEIVVNQLNWFAFLYEHTL